MHMYICAFRPLFCCLLSGEWNTNEIFFSRYRGTKIIVMNRPTVGAKKSISRCRPCHYFRASNNLYICHAYINIIHNGIIQRRKISVYIPVEIKFSSKSFIIPQHNRRGTKDAGCRHIIGLRNAKMKSIYNSRRCGNASREIGQYFD